ncbi:SDR family NAD(P)-dependent oxidoreductase [Actinosynnema sp. NPDC059797]
MTEQDPAGQDPAGQNPAGQNPAGQDPAGQEAGRDAGRDLVDQGTAIAVIGMAGRFPGAPDVARLWRNVLDGVESIRRLTDDELDAAGVDPVLRADPRYVRVAAPVDGVEEFDAAFFGYSPREAELADPQHRLFLECCWEALEVAGYASARYDGLIGVFGGASISTYWHRISSDRELFSSINEYQAIIGGDKDALTTMVSYKLGLRGPSIAVQTFCSTSLVAVHLACQSLRTGESDVALAGGVTVRVPDRVGHLYQEGGMGSPDGHVRSFDARAAGSMFGDGSAVVALKRLSDAVADGDDVVAVIRGSAVNNDGSVKVGFTAPSVGGQVAVIRRALADAGLSPEDIGCVEAHGTATELGDPIEVAALNAVFGPGRPGTCALGSAKTNVGHLDHAAGVAGLIKAALSVRHGVIPPSLHFERPNPEIDFSAGPFYVNTELREWPDRDGPRRAGLNSLGLGGTNAHVVVEEPPPPPPADPPGRPHQLLVFSGRADAAVDELVASVADVLADDGVALADAAYTLQVGRREFEHRRAVVAADTAEAVAALRAGEVLSTADVEFEVDRPVAFVFPDAAADAEDLYEREPVFRAAVDECRALPDRGPAAEAFTTGYALARLLTSWGLRPDALAGHGAGECVAACLSGALTLPEAVRLAVERARLAPSELAEWARANLDPAVPTIPYVSGTTGEWASASPEDWGREPGAEPVDLVDAVTRGSSRIAVRVGAGRLAGAVPTLAEDGGDRQRSVLTAVARLWLAGVPVDWAGLHAGERRRRVPLPTYPFQRRLYWLAPTEPAAQGGAGKALSALSREDPDRWLYLPAWRQTAPPAPAAGGGAPWLALVGGPAGEAVADAVAEEVGRSGGEVIRVRPGDGFAVLDDGSHTARPDSRADLKAVLARLWEADRRPRRLLHLLTLDTDPGAPAEQVLDRGFHSVVALAQALQDLGTGEVRVDVVTRGTQRVLGDEPLLPEQAAVVGPCRVVPLESPTTACRLIDVVLPDDRTPPAGLLAELAAEPEDRAVALRAGRRWVPAYEPVPAPPAPPSPVRDGGVYVVTGGLGGIGLAMAERLARAARARVVLLGRTGLPRRADWPALLADDQLDADVRRRVEGVRRIEATGAEVLVLATDVGDEEEVRAALATARERFGPITGVLHAAGVPGLGLLPFKQREAADRVLRPKVAGTRALERALRDDPVEFVVLFSSITSLTGGGPGQVDYCAANAFLDAWAHRAADDGRRVVAVDWGEWRWNAWDVGLAGYDARVREFFRVTRERFGIDFDEGWAALTAALATGLPQVVVSTQDFRAVADLGGLFTTEAVRRQGPAERHPRPDLTTTFVAPGTPVERTVADIWADALGVAEIGVRDNFFELGGNSLVGVDVVTRVRAAFPGADLAPHALYEAPTVRALARLVGGEGDARDGREQDDRQARGARRRQALGQVRSRT